MSDYNERPMTTGDWFITILLLAIPLVNIILFIVWACGVGNRNRCLLYTSDAADERG